jgi:hypothetical protein
MSGIFVENDALFLKTTATSNLPGDRSAPLPVLVLAE